MPRLPCVAVLALALALGTGTPVAKAAEDAFPNVAAAYLVKRDGRVLWQAAPERRLPPASLTKMMTALLALESERIDGVAVVSRAAAAETGARIGLRAGDRLRARDLLAAAVIRSANDACRALAEHVGGDLPRFVALMNRRGKALGLRQTHFVDPCGHDHSGHYSSAADLAHMAEALAQHPDYLRLAETPQARIATLDGARSFEFDNTNALVGRYDGAIGLKTGFTRRAGKCLVALAERNGVRVLLVMLNAPNRWWDAVEMLDRAFASN